MKQGDSCYVKDFQEFGPALILLDERHTHNIDNELMEYPIWSGYIIASNSKYAENLIAGHHTILATEHDLTLIEKNNQKVVIKEIDVSYVFSKFATFLDICYGKVESDLDFHEILSMFMSNFTGEEMMALREAQKQ